MSAIDTTFTWVRNPTNLNSLQTTYVSKRGSDTTGNGTAQNPYASIAKATSIATAGTNIMLDDYSWSEQRTLNNRAFRWWGNGRTEINDSIADFTVYGGDTFNYFNGLIFSGAGEIRYYCHYCNYVRCKTYSSFSGYYSNLYNTVFPWNVITQYVHNCNLVNCSSGGNLTLPKIFYNNVIMGTTAPAFSGVGCDYNNYTTFAIPTTNGANSHSINNASTGQTFADYFNHYDATDWSKCDFTAKEGSKNIGAGEKGTTIGFNQGFTMYADNSANDMFSVSNGATLKNI